MTTFVQLHILTSYGPSNLNRDDLGRPKSAIVGGKKRLRVSSQSLKRAWRTSEVFDAAIGEHVGIRTKRMAEKAKDQLVAGGVSEKNANEWSKALGEQLGKDTVVHLSPFEQERVDAIVSRLIAENRAPKPEDQILTQDKMAADVAMFGRMLAKTPEFNIDAAVQVAHAFTTHEALGEEDFFTAVDDLNNRLEDAGAGHMGETEFGAGVFYEYICVNWDQLVKNLNGDKALAQSAIKALTQAALQVSPGGKQNSFASRAYANFVLAERGSQQPRSLANAFIDPVARGAYLTKSVEQLLDGRKTMEDCYGACADSIYELDATKGTGRLPELLKFVALEG